MGTSILGGTEEVSGFMKNNAFCRKRNGETFNACLLLLVRKFWPYLAQTQHVVNNVKQSMSREQNGRVHDEIWLNRSTQKKVCSLRILKVENRDNNFQQAMMEKGQESNKVTVIVSSEIVEEYPIKNPTVTIRYGGHNFVMLQKVVGVFHREFHVLWK